MIDFKELRRRCASCTKGEYWRCRECWIWKVLNTPCEFCSRIGGTVPFTKVTAEGLKQFTVCLSCLEKLT